ncbi:extracellular glycosidase [Penicillium canariense]|uniref:Crh-like protein n=1 Tax=Penicillium canariense TaxID=189055 RepID=A0A9W9I8T7_9EURO|nr:extracellular glycosidase [Penicillium canariense]KAJ5168889.1 extracellular glycosidase [Penicillium canariense]
MKLALGTALGLLCSSALVMAQTYTDCNPLEKSESIGLRRERQYTANQYTACPADPALGKSDQTFDFTSGSSSQFAATGAVTYDSTNGATFTISKKGDGPLIQSGWYIMFGKVEYTIKAASGTGIVSSAVLQSDDLDEIDWEWLGGNNAQVQTNYFGKGDTSSYNRGAYHDNPGNHDGFHTYSVDWTSSQIVWAIDGQTVRVLTPSTADSNQYPQTPMMIKVGVWAGGDPDNAQGTIDWAGGVTDYSQGPFNMYLKSMTVTDYSTGNSYSYGDKSGSWESITADGGKVNGNSANEPTSTASAPTITATVDSVPIPWSGTHRETSSFVTPDVWPWVATGSPTASTGLSSGWESASRQIQPPGRGSVSELYPAPTNPSLVSTTKNGTPMSQSISPFTSAPLASSSAASSRSGLKTPDKNATRVASSTSASMSTTTRHRQITDEADTTMMSAPTATVNSSPGVAASDVAPSVGSGFSLYQVPAVLSTVCFLLGGIFAVL